MLTAESIAKLQASLDLALENEGPKLRKVQRSFQDLERYPIDLAAAHPFPILATVATDGGENQLRLDPMRLHILRVADSVGQIHFEEFIPLSLDADELIKVWFLDSELLSWLLDYCKLNKADFFPKSAIQREKAPQLLRELLEWAALLHLAVEHPEEPLLLVRDGLLRSILIPEMAWDVLRKKFRKAYRKSGHLLVGVAKRSAALNYLSLALGLESILPPGKTGWIPISAEMEREASPPSYRWYGPKNMGELVLARLTASASLMYACEIPKWLAGERTQIIAALAVNAEGSYPSTGYPLCLLEAHRYAHIGGIEIQFLERLLLDRLRQHDPRLAEEVALQQLLGRRLTLPEEAMDA